MCYYLVEYVISGYEAGVVGAFLELWVVHDDLVEGYVVSDAANLEFPECATCSCDCSWSVFCPDDEFGDH